MKIIDYLKWRKFDKKNPQLKRPEDFIMFVGDKGCGKSVSLQYHQSIVRKFYDVPIKIYANYQSKYAENKIIKTPQDLLDCEGNSVIYIDEANDKFDSREWQKFPKNLLQLITQNRHCAKSIIMAGQLFKDVDLRIRDKVSEIIEVTNWKHRWIFWKLFDNIDYKAVVKADETGKVIYNSEGNEAIQNFRGSKCKKRLSFIATNELYESYNDKDLIFGL